LKRLSSRGGVAFKGFKARAAERDAQENRETVMRPGICPVIRGKLRFRLREEIMRTLIALVSMVLSGSSLADSVRHLQVPERFWGTWARSPDLCRDKKSIIVVTEKGYVTPEASCEIQWLTETAGGSGPIYSAHMRCTSLAAPDEKTELNRIILPKEGGQLSAGPDFQNLTHYQRCPAN
jgi:hypothetical protein